MARRGRKPTGAALVESLEGSPHARDRFSAIVATIAGQQTIPDACEELGIRESMFHKMRGQALQAAMDRLEPRPLGRPPLTPSPEAQRIAELEEELQRLRTELKAAQVRLELAQKLPLAARPRRDTTLKKTTRGGPKRPRRLNKAKR